MIFMGFLNVLNKPLMNGYSSKRPHNVYPGSLKQNRTFRLIKGTGLLQACKKSTITFFNSSIAQEIYGDKVSDGCSEKWATKNIRRKHRECKTSV